MSNREGENITEKKTKPGDNHCGSLRMKVELTALVGKRANRKDRHVRVRKRQAGIRIYLSSSLYLTPATQLLWSNTHTWLKTQSRRKATLLKTGVSFASTCFPLPTKWKDFVLVHFCQLDTDKSHLERGSFNWGNASIRLACGHVCWGVLLINVLWHDSATPG